MGRVYNCIYIENTKRNGENTMYNFSDSAFYSVAKQENDWRNEVNEMAFDAECVAYVKATTVETFQFESFEMDDKADWFAATH